MAKKNRKVFFLKASWTPVRVMGQQGKRRSPSRPSQCCSLFPDRGHQSTPTTPAKRSSSEVWLFLK